MASGNINGSVSYNASYMSFGCNWSSVSNGATANTSTLTINTYWQTTKTAKKWDTVGTRTGNYVNIYVNGTLVVNDTFSQRFNCDPWPSNPYTIRTTTYTVQHDNNGNAPTIEIEAFANGIASSGGKQYGPGNSSVNRTAITIDNIPRYPNVSAQVSSVGYGIIGVNWYADSNCDNLWYSTDGGNNWVDKGAISGTSGHFEITGLTPNTNYNIRVKAKRIDSQLSGESNIESVNTILLPRVVGSNGNITIGGTLIIDILNTLYSQLTIEMYDTNNTLLDTITTSDYGTYSYDTTGKINALYSSIPNTTSGNFHFITKVVEGGITYTYSTSTGTYNIDTATSKPEYTSVVYEDTNNDTLSITSDNQKIVSNNSTIKFDVSGITAKNSASIVSCKLTQLSTSADLTISGNTASVSNVVVAYENTRSKNITITLTDSRGLTYSQTIQLDLVNYSNPSGTFSVKRESNYYSNTIFLVNANYSHIGSNTLTIKTRQKQQESSTWSNYTTLTNNTATTISLDNQYYWDIEIEISDSLHSTTYTTRIARGMPIMYYDVKKNSVGINTFPEHNKSLEVDDDVYVSGNMQCNGDIDITGNMVVAGNLSASNIYDNNYSTSEVRIGTYMGKPLYRKVVDTGDLSDPNRWNDNKLYIGSVATNVDTIVNYKLMGKNSYSFEDLNNISWYSNNVECIARVVMVDISGYGDYALVITTYNEYIHWITSSKLYIEYTTTTD